jgi:molecular chaperone HscB
MTSTYRLRSEAHRCDECGREMAYARFCDACGADFPERRGLGPFAVLGLTARFDVDSEELERLERELVTRLHPDRWQQRGEALYRKAVIAQSGANEALAQVQDPLSRAELLLELDDGAVREGLHEAGKVDTGFLVEQLELQEEAAAEPDEPRRRELMRRARQEGKALVAEMAAGFADGDPKRVRAAVDRYRYWRNLGRAVQGRAE